MKCLHSLFRAFQMLQWLIGIVFKWPTLLLNQVLELLLTTWRLGVDDAFDLIDV